MKPTTAWSGLCLLLLICVSGTTAAAERVYKTTDKYGNVVFSDTPPPEASQQQKTTERVDVRQPNTFEPVALPEREPWIVEGEGGEEEEPTYTSIAIAQPGNDETLRDNAGNVAVSLRIEPGLRVGHTVQLYMDDALVGSGPVSQFLLENTDRGSHSLRAEVVDGSGTVVIASESAVFHLQKYSQLTAPNRPPVNLPSSQN